VPVRPETRDEHTGNVFVGEKARCH
jgi:hypothetical protein